MELTLKKALKLRSKLEAFVSDVALPTASELSIFVSDVRSNPEVALKEAADRLQKDLDEKVRASSILSGLRAAVAKVNAENGVEQMLAQQAHLERTIAFNKQIVAAALQPVEDAIKGELEVLHKQAVEGQQPTVGYRGLTKAGTFSVVTVQMRDDAKKRIADATRSKEEIEDARGAVNLTAKIRIADDDAVFLREHSFV